MAETEVKEVAIEELSQEEYKKARAEGKTVVEQPVEKPVEEPEKEVEEQEEEPEVAEEKPKVSGGFQKRIQRLTKEKAEAEEKAAQLEKRLQALESKEKAAAPTSNEEPKPDDFKTYEEYLKAFARWEVKQELKAEREAAQKASDEAQASEIWEAHNERVIAAKAKYEDYDDVVNVPTPWTLENPTPQERASAEAFRIAVLEDDNSAEILYHYGGNPEEFAKLGEMTPAQVVKAVARLSDKIVPAKAEEKHEKPKSKAPTPIRPVSGGSSKSSVPLSETETMAEYKKRRAAGERS